MKKVVKEFWGRVGSRLAAKASLVQREVANEMSRRDCRQKPCLSFISPSAGRGLLQGLVSTPARRGIVCSRLSASRSFTKGIHLYACPAWGYFSVKKSNQKSLGEDPETPYASVRPDRKVYDLPDLGLDDAYKVNF